MILRVWFDELAIVDAMRLCEYYTLNSFFDGRIHNIVPKMFMNFCMEFETVTCAIYLENKTTISIKLHGHTTTM